MARYIKANSLVAKFLKLENTRNAVKDGNYLFWQNDMLAFGPLTQLTDTLRQIGGIALRPHEAREEQDGVKLRPLPIAEDKRFVFPASEEKEEEVVEPTDTPTVIPEYGEDNYARPGNTATVQPEPETEWVEPEETVSPLGAEKISAEKALSDEQSAEGEALSGDEAKSE